MFYFTQPSKTPCFRSSHIACLPALVGQYSSVRTVDTNGWIIHCMDIYISLGTVRWIHRHTAEQDQIRIYSTVSLNYLYLAPPVSTERPRADETLFPHAPAYNCSKFPTQSTRVIRFHLLYFCFYFFLFFHFDSWMILVFFYSSLFKIPSCSHSSLILFF